MKNLMIVLMIALAAGCAPAKIKSMPEKTVAAERAPKNLPDKGGRSNKEMSPDGGQIIPTRPYPPVDNS